MKVITLPKELDLTHLQSVNLFDYTSSTELRRQQLILTQHTFSFLLEGTKEVVFDNSTLSVDNSRFLLMKSGNCLMTEKLSDNQHYRSVLLFFPNEILLKFIRRHLPNRTEFSEYKSVYAFQYDAFIQRFLESVLDISKLSKDIQKKLLEVKFDEIMLYLTDKYGTDFLYALIEKSSHAIQNFIQTVETNRLQKLTLKELSFLCNMSISTFKREFEKHYAEPPIKWFQNKRLEYAHYLLNKEHKTSTEIYLEMGYENLSSFIQAYKLKYGNTPKQNTRK